jgi:hypothetical protein
MAVTRLSVLIWGFGGSGKTTLACTAPGKKLIINLDPDGPHSVRYRSDVDVLDLSGLSTDDVLAQLKSDSNPLGLDKVLNDDTYQTVILDSATSLAQRALENSVKQGIGRSAKFTPSMEFPGLSAYGGRNAIVLTCIKGLLRVTGRNNKHCIIISHEDDPKVNDEGVVMYITLMLGGKLVNAFTVQLGEIWWLQTDEKSGERRIAIKPCRSHKPMKTRLFKTDSLAEFPISYDPEDWKNLTNNPIASWWKRWSDSKGSKLELPRLTKSESTPLRKVK